MLNVTDSASEHLVQLLNEADAPDGTAARFVARSEGLSLELDNPRPGDETHEHDGRTVLLLDEQVAGMLDQRTLDLEDTDDGSALALS